MAGGKKRRSIVGVVVPHLPAWTRSSLLPTLNSERCRKRATDMIVEYFRRWLLRSRAGSTFHELNGGMFRKLTSKRRFPPPEVMQVTCMAHSSRRQSMSKSRSRCVLDCATMAMGIVGGKWVELGTAFEGAPVMGRADVAVMKPCISLSVQPSNRARRLRLSPSSALLLLRPRGVYLDLERFENTNLMSYR